MKNLVLAILVTTALISCSGKKVVDASAATTTKSNVISSQASEVKDKGKKFDVEFGIVNETEKNIIILLADILCYKGNTQGVVQHAFFGAGERTIDMSPKQKKNFHIVCKLGGKVEGGDYKLVVSRVYDNPSNDRRTTGKEIAKGIEWKLANADKH